MFQELSHPAAPSEVQDWAAVLPNWVEIVRPETSVVLARLDPGEIEAIALAIELSADVVLMVDQTGRR